MADETPDPIAIDDDDADDVDKIDIDETPVWEELDASFDKKASLQIAKWVLWIFSGVYTACFVMSFGMMCMDGATFDGGQELVKFLLTSILPLVTLAVGYYLGDRGQQET